MTTASPSQDQASIDLNGGLFDLVHCGWRGDDSPHRIKAALRSPWNRTGGAQHAKSPLVAGFGSGASTLRTARIRFSFEGQHSIMQIIESVVSDAYVLTPTPHSDDRGLFLEWYRFDRLEEIRGHALALRQANCSVSGRGVLRGVHAAAVPPSQAKYVTCVQGAVLDVVVDIRMGSPTFGMWDAVQLDDVDRSAVYVSEGLGHAFFALSDGATVIYLCSEVYAPSREFGIHPLDPQLGINWPPDIKPRLSPKDDSTPTLAQAAEAGLLPTYEDCLAYYDTLRSSSKA